MKIIGIIAEYNPFHNGHIYQLKKCRELFPDCLIIIAMSGNFTQRAEPAVIDKQTRAKAAVICGADLVLELPFLYAVSGAESFARGAIRLFESLNCIDMLVFGCENNFEKLNEAAEILNEETPEYRDSLKEYLKDGISYAEARQNVLEKHYNIMPEILNRPNNILAIEYLKALKRFNSKIIPQSIIRTGAEHNEKDLDNEFSSAGALRVEIAKHGCTDIFFNNVPAVLKDIYRNSEFLTDLNIFFRLICAKIRTMKPECLKNISEVGEGVEQRIIKAARTAVSYEDLVDKIQTRRYPYSRVRRILLNCLFGITKRIANRSHRDALYARVLGANKESGILNLAAQSSRIPLIVKSKDFISSELLKYDIMASEIYGVLTPTVRNASSDYICKPYII